MRELRQEEIKNLSCCGGADAGEIAKETALVIGATIAAGPVGFVGAMIDLARRRGHLS